MKMVTRWTMLMMFVLLLILLQPASAQLEQNASTSWSDTGSTISVLEQLECDDINSGTLDQYGQALCGDTVNFTCMKIGETALQPEIKTGNTVITKEKRGIPTWESLWGDTTERAIVMKINRRNIKLQKGDVLAIPRNMTGKTYMDYSPYPEMIDPAGEKMIIWDPSLLAFAAYDEAGYLIRWGPAAGGKDYSPDVKRSCHTKVGEFKIIRKEGPDYRSGRYPLGCSGKKCALMPYASFFQGQGYAFHAGNVPGANASHGCVRVFYSDAKWLSTVFLEVGTKVIIKPYPPPKK
jgi:L,D-transpeptidase ErfK/SrfK